MASGHGASLHFGNLLFLEATDRIAERSKADECRINITVEKEVQVVNATATTHIRRAGPIIAARTDIAERAIIVVATTRRRIPCRLSVVLEQQAAISCFI